MTGEIHLNFHAKRDAHPGGPGSQLCTSTACLADIGRAPHKIMLATDDDRDKDLTRIRAMVAEAATDHDAAVILYDLSEPAVAQDFECTDDWKLPATRERLAALSRDFLIEQFQAFDDHGIDCAAVIPARHDLETMARWAAREEVDLIVVPGTWAHPSMADRLRGHVLARLTDHTHVPVAVYESGGSSWLANAAAVHA